MGRGNFGLRSITVDADVDIEDFSDDVILEVAAEIITRFLKKDPCDDAWWKDTNTAIEAVATSLKVRVLLPNENDLPPPSTAAKIRTPEQLKDFINAGKVP